MRYRTYARAARDLSDAMACAKYANYKRFYQTMNDYYHTNNVSDQDRQIPIIWEKRMLNIWIILIGCWLTFIIGSMYHMVTTDNNDIAVPSYRTITQLDRAERLLD